MADGLFIALEGIDGAGTTTQLQRLAGALRLRGHAVLTTAEPSDGQTGKLLRQALTGSLRASEAELALLFAADRLQHVARIVAPARAAGQIVLCDRYLLSSYAYQSTRLPLSWVQAINAQAPPPDMYLLLTVDPDVAAERRAARGAPAELFDALPRQREVAAAYARLASGPDAMARVYTVNADAPLHTVTETALATLLGALPSLANGEAQQGGRP